MAGISNWCIRLLLGCGRGTTSSSRCRKGSCAGRVDWKSPVLKDGHIFCVVMDVEFLITLRYDFGSAKAILDSRGMNGEWCLIPGIV